MAVSGLLRENLAQNVNAASGQCRRGQGVALQLTNKAQRLQVPEQRADRVATDIKCRDGSGRLRICLLN